MFIELIDQLRCTNTHEQSWLVASFTRRADRFVLDATLGCPICFREYPIIDGIAYFGTTPTPKSPASADPNIAMRAAAFLNATERATLVLAGTWATHAHAVADLLPLRIFTLDPATHIDDSDQVATISSSEGIPLTHSTIDGVALDSTTATEINVRTAIAALKPGGRLVAPAHIEPPTQVAILARDDQYWVGETEKPFVSLRRA
jgi:hypothetical protein